MPATTHRKRKLSARLRLLCGLIWDGQKNCLKRPGMRCHVQVNST